MAFDVSTKVASRCGPNSNANWSCPTLGVPASPDSLVTPRPVSVLRWRSNRRAARHLGTLLYHGGVPSRTFE